MQSLRSLQLSRRCSEADLKRSCHLGKLDIDNLMFKSPTLDMTPKRKRKRHRIDEDTISVQSMDLDSKKRRRSSLAKMTSLSNLLSPLTPVKKMGQTLSKSLSLRKFVFTPTRKCPLPENSKNVATPRPAKVAKRTLSLKNLLSPSPSRKKDTIKSYQAPAPTPPKRRLSTFWYETVEEDTKQKCTHSERKRQEACIKMMNTPDQEAIYLYVALIITQPATKVQKLNSNLSRYTFVNYNLFVWQAIFELYKNEEDLIEDLNMVKTTYHDSLCKLRLMTEDDLKQIFGSLYDLMPLHQDLVEQLRGQRLPDGTTEFIGEVLLDWIPRLRVYVPYCANQVYARALLDQKKRDPAIDDFLQRCQESPFSRHLDLWSFLDIPRSRLVKYPLLLKNIQKLTPSFHSDHDLLERAVAALEEIIQEVDVQTGEAKCHFTYNKLEFIDEKQRHPMIGESKVILCDGILKNNRGTKLHAFLFERIFVLTRPATRGQQLRYQVYRQPIPASEIVLDDLQDGESKRGSFRSTFSQNSSGKHQFRLSFGSSQKGQSHTLQANDEHDKRQWLSCIRNVLAKEREILGIETTAEIDKDCVVQNRPMTRSVSRCSFRLSRKGSTSSLASLTSIGSFSSLYSINSVDSMGDSEDSRSIFSLASTSSQATKSSSEASVNSSGSLGSSDTDTQTNTQVETEVDLDESLEAGQVKAEQSSVSPVYRRSSRRSATRRSSYSPPQTQASQDPETTACDESEV